LAGGGRWSDGGQSPPATPATDTLQSKLTEYFTPEAATAPDKAPAKAPAPTKAAKAPAKAPAPAKAAKAPTKATKTDLPAAALAYARQLVKDEYGACTVIRALTQHHPKLTRHEVLAIAAELGLNRFTTSRQYHLVRSGAVTVDL